MRYLKSQEGSFLQDINGVYLICLDPSYKGSKIFILDESYNKKGILKTVNSANKVESINAEYTLDFDTNISFKQNLLIGDDTVYEIDDDYFDTALMSKTVENSKSIKLKVETEHVSYRLNKKEYDLDTFSATGTISYIISKILEGTEFSVDVVEYTNSVSYIVNTKKSRRALLIEFLENLGYGEYTFNKFKIGVVERRGGPVAKILINGKHINGVIRTVDKRETRNNNDLPLITVSCVPLPIMFLDNTYVLGDAVIIVQPELNIREQLRIVKIQQDPYRPENTTFEFSNVGASIGKTLYDLFKNRG